MSLEQNNIDIVTSLVVGEHADNGDEANDDTPTSGLFLKPSVVSGRPSDITDYLASAADEYGKVAFVEQTFDLDLSPRVDVTQIVDINNPVTANGRHGKITTVPLMVINTGDFEEFVVNNEYVNEDSIILVMAEINSFTNHLFANVVDIVNGAFTVRLNNYYSSSYNNTQLKVNYAVL